MPTPNSDRFIIKRNDTLPALQVCLWYEKCLGQPAPFSLSSVTAITFSMADDCGYNKVFQQDAQIISYSGGTIQYNWQVGDTNESGSYKGEFELFFDDGKKMSIPGVGFIKIQIEDDINGT